MLFVDHREYEDERVALVICAVLQAVSIFLWWWFAARIIMHWHYKQTDSKWIGDNKRIAWWAAVFWATGIAAAALGMWAAVESTLSAKG